MKQILLVAIVLFIGLSSNAQYIKVIKDGVNIRAGASANSQVICKSKSGDIFSSENLTGDWYSVKIGLADEKRFIHKSMCKVVNVLPNLPSSSTCKKIFLDFRRAEKKAMDKADMAVSATSSNYIKRLADAEAKYFSVYTMEVFHKYQIAPALYGKIVELGFKNNWNTINIY